MAKSKQQRIARIRAHIAQETYQQALDAVIAGGKAIPGLSPEYSSAISRDYPKGGYTALWTCPECWCEGVLNLQTLPALHRLLTAEQREDVTATIADALDHGDKATALRIAEDVSRQSELKMPPIDAAWLCLVCITEYGKNDITACENCRHLTTDPELSICGWCWDR
ncbi:hypothetical protein OG780_42975 [Streptomyces sp. NBC_00386]|uniref:hypothetical protein n=1 Tax=Streptomyces sp. NBC_00386 TaxID=2975734 RepID=UPI002E1B3734